MGRWTFEARDGSRLEVNHLELSLLLEFVTWCMKHNECGFSEDSGCEWMELKEKLFEAWKATA